MDTSTKPGSSGLHIALARSDDDKHGRPYLGDPVVIDNLLRGLAIKVINRQVEVANGKLSQEAAVAADQADAGEMAQILRGSVTGYEPMGDWNHTGLPALCASRLGIANDDPDAVMRNTVAMFIAEIYGAVQLQIDDHTEEARAKIDGAVEDWVAMALGAPQDDDATPPA